MRARVVKGESGFTLPEMMVTIMVMLVVLVALYNIFDASVRIFSFGNKKVEAVESARIGLERMEREIRAAYPVNGYNSTGAQRYLFFTADGTKTNSPPSTTNAPVASMPGASSITFGNELGAGDGTIRCPSGGTCEYVTYKLTDANNATASCTATPCTLRRVNTVNGSLATSGGDAMVEGVLAPVAGDATKHGIRFRYFAATACNSTVGAEINPNSPGSCTQADIGRVEISLQVQADKGTQTLATEVDLRN